jgi:hypothetical protein
MQEVFLVAVLERAQQLLHDACDVNLLKLDLLILHEPHQIMLHVLKHEIEGAAVLAEVHSLLLVRHDLSKLHYVPVVELAKDFDLANGGDGKTLFLVLKTHFLQRDHLLRVQIACLIDLPVSP